MIPIVNWPLLYALIDRAKREPVQVSDHFWRLLIRLKDSTGKPFVYFHAECDPGERIDWLTRWQWLEAAWV